MMARLHGTGLQARQVRAVALPVTVMRLRCVLVLLCGLLLSAAAGAVTVSGSPSTCVSVSGNGSNWSNPGRAVSSNGSYATASVDGSTTDYLLCTGYNFSIPAGATINGITVDVERRSNSTDDGGSADVAVRLTKDGVIGSTDRSTPTVYTTSDVIESHGGANDLWGTNWSAVDINDASFGVAFAATKDDWRGAAHTIYVDWIRVTVDYTPFACAPPANIPSGVSVSCVCDTFGRTSLNPSTIFGGNWTVSNSDNISNPYINQVTGLLRLTENTGNNAKAATAPGIFPASGNYISVEFNHYAYNGSGADGVGVTLSDYSVPAVPGAFGGSLGYAQKTPPAVTTNVPGFAGGWIGVGLDEYGNFQSATEGRVLGCSGPACRPQSVGLRGPGRGVNGYRWIGGTASNVGIDSDATTSPAPGYMYQVIVDARGSGTGQVNVSVNRDTTTRNGANYTALFGPSNVYNEAQYALSQGWISKLVPDYWKISFTASTGGSTNIHEIGSLRICAQTIIPSTGGTASGFSTIDEAYPAAPSSTVPAYQNFQTGGIYMKLAGVPFRLWTAALTSTGISTAYSAVSDKYVRVNLVDNSDNACGSDAARTCNGACTGKATVENGASQIVAYSSSDRGAKLSPAFTLNSAYRNLIAVIKECTNSSCTSYTSTAPACSADSFSVRPTGIESVVSTNATNAGTSGTPVFKAGAGSFNLTATTTGVAGSPSRYTGSLKINNRAVQAVSPATEAGAVSGEIFEAAASGTPSSTATGNFTYSEVGAFRFLGYPVSNATAPRGVFDGVHSAIECASPMSTADCDARKAITWTGVDSVSTKNDCVADSYSNTKDSEGRYGCNFGITADTPAFGRFIPNHFGVTGAAISTRSGAGCSPASSFTYMGEPARVSFTLQALNASNAVTRNYTGALAKLSTTDWLTYGSANSIGLWMLASEVPVGAVNCTAVFSNATPSSTTFACTGVAAPASVVRAAGPRVSIAGTPTTPNWVAGQSSFAADVVLERADRPDGPYAKLNIGIAPQDGDNVSLSSFNLDADNSGTNERASLGSTPMFYGQARIENAYGSERLALPVKVGAAYWNGTRFTMNSVDSCTPTAGFTLNGWKGGLEENSTGISNAGALLNGERRLSLSAPSPMPTAKGSVMLNSNLSYLPGNGQATFGIYRGRFIYLREMY